MNEKQYPLRWPNGWPRTQSQKHPLFQSKSIDWEANDVVRELKLMGAKNIIINSNMQYRQDGMPYTRQNVYDSGVAVYFNLNGEEQCVPCDKWVRLEDNLRAIAKTINSLRGIERWGAKDMVNAAFRGFKALPASYEMPAPKRDWWVVLGVAQDANALEVKAAYRDHIKLHHPDVGGDAAEFKQIKEAYEEWDKIR